MFEYSTIANDGDNNKANIKADLQIKELKQEEYQDLSLIKCICIHTHTHTQRSFTWQTWDQS